MGHPRAVPAFACLLYTSQLPFTLLSRSCHDVKKKARHREAAGRGDPEPVVEAQLDYFVALLLAMTDCMAS